MPKIIIETDPTSPDGAQATLTERVIAANLGSPYYAAQLIERLAWATSDAEALESVRPPASRPATLEVLDSPLKSAGVLVTAS